MKDYGYITEQQKKRINDLEEKQTYIRDEINQSRQILSADKFQSNVQNIEKVDIGHETTHVLQWNAFADTMAKKCPKCSRPMKLQWARELSYVSPTDFYWGCTGWYFQSNQIKGCKFTQRLTKDDLSLMTDVSAPEFELSSQDFNIILHDPNTSESILERMDDLQADLRSKKKGIDIVCCPIHAEPMVLQKKRNGVGLLDQYYLRCAHWAQNDQGCNYIEKLKSGSQLAALLKNQTGIGIL
ncbi:hypothetical protein [Acinetobacter wanghuae]|uniref:hypothetical protein n=1 Tax=Acinetobacter wanghuae TaxID=2662362 RepID=UPI001D0DBF95|nr:hypothetical protein [Acinetobacter wanghuae]